MLSFKVRSIHFIWYFTSDDCEIAKCVYSESLCFKFFMSNIRWITFRYPRQFVHLPQNNNKCLLHNAHTGSAVSNKVPKWVDSVDVWPLNLRSNIKRTEWQKAKTRPCVSTFRKKCDIDDRTPSGESVATSRENSHFINNNNRRRARPDLLRQ